MNLWTKGEITAPDLFSDIAAFAAGSELSLFARTDYSLRLVRSPSGLSITHGGFDHTGDSSVCHHLDLELIEYTLIDSPFLIVGGFTPGAVTHPKSILSNLVYLAGSPVVDVLTSSPAVLNSPISALMIFFYVPELDLLVAYKNSSLLREGSILTGSAGHSPVIVSPDGIDFSSLWCPTITGARQVKDTLVTSGRVDIDLLPEFTEAQATALLSKSRFNTNQSYTISGRRLSIESPTMGYLTLTPDLGAISELSEETSLNFIIIPE